MPKRRFKWWADVQQMLYDYPDLIACGPKDAKERRKLEAVQRALAKIHESPKATETEAIIDMVFFRKTHSRAKAAIDANVGEATCYRRIADVIFAIAEELGYLTVYQKS